MRRGPGSLAAAEAAVGPDRRFRPTAEADAGYRSRTLLISAWARIAWPA